MFIHHLTSKVITMTVVTGDWNVPIKMYQFPFDASPFLELKVNFEPSTTNYTNTFKAD